MTDSLATPRVLTGVHAGRYGEVLVVNANDDALLASVYNSFTLGDCPDELFSKLDPVAIAAEFGALAVIVNGPRYWLMDTIEKVPVDAPVVHDFGGILMVRVAELDLGAMAFDPSPYKERHVTRGAVFSYDAGTTVFELTKPEGAVYVMQSWCTSEDRDLVESDLSNLASRLPLPEGWSYGIRVLDAPLVIDTKNLDAIVLQDDLKNTYSLVR